MKKNIYWLIAGIINLLTAILHLIGGQLELINPFMKSLLSLQVKSELLGAWHMVTLLLFITSYKLLKAGFGKTADNNASTIKLIGYSYLLFSLPSLVISIYSGLFIPQWVLLAPIGIIAIIGNKKHQQNS